MASDHTGFELKSFLSWKLKALGHKVIDLGTDSGRKPSDYPDYAKKTALGILAEKAERGILICGSGVGACIAANKFPGIRAGVCHDTYSAKQAVEHDDLNVLCLGARVVGTHLAWEITETFVNAEFSKEERHVKRLKKIKSFETKNWGIGV